MGLFGNAQEAELEKLEQEYAEATGGDALITNETAVTKRYTFADGGTATGTDDAIKSARALVRFAQGLRGDKK